MVRVAEAAFGGVSIAICTDKLLAVDADAVVISANNRLDGQTGWARTIADSAGQDYAHACAELRAAAGPDGLPQGSAWSIGSIRLAGGSRTVIQAVTIGYRDDLKIRASSAVVYHATRSALEVAKATEARTVALYLFAIRPDYGSERGSTLVDALLRAIVDHGEARPIGSATVLVCESDPKRRDLARECFYRAESLWRSAQLSAGC